MNLSSRGLCITSSNSIHVCGEAQTSPLATACNKARWGGEPALSAAPTNVLVSKTTR